LDGTLGKLSRLRRFGNGVRVDAELGGEGEARLEVPFRRGETTADQPHVKLIEVTVYDNSSADPSPCSERTAQLIFSYNDQD
jgi:hypothetical protein